MKELNGRHPEGRPMRSRRGGVGYWGLRLDGVKALMVSLSAFLVLLLAVFGYYVSIPTEFEYKAMMNGLWRKSVVYKETYETPLHIAAEEGRNEDLLDLLSGYDVDQLDASLGTPLHRASASKHTETARILLQRGADPNAQNIAERTPLHYAIQFGAAEVVQLLIEHGADVNLMAHDLSPLYLAVSMLHLEIVQKLVSAGAHVSRRNMYHDTPIHLAVERDNLPILAVLVKGKGIYIDRPNRENHSPLSVAVYKGFCGLVPTLLKAGADPLENPEQREYSLLHVAVMRGEKGCVEALLLANSEDRYIATASTKTCSPLYLAVQADNIEIVQLLRNFGASIGGPCDIATAAKTPKMKEVLQLEN
eukprot:TRINITY_DN4416_c0_g1_i2.p1 TRINITY_DN4416_c0_g1~~TRINITY_DN4416_c0_g1_i2.p1  ORF type:complete len:382 (+),score=48.80 TRINITY_DN4416_c0_g1_i2:59-1147(+)